MRLALVLEKDVGSSRKTAGLLKLFGYRVALVATPREAFNVARGLNADVIVTFATSAPEERRLVTNELKRLAPEATVILLTDGDAEHAHAKAHGFPGVDAIMQRPISLEALRRVLESELDNTDPRCAAIKPDLERRKR